MTRPRPHGCLTDYGAESWREAAHVEARDRRVVDRLDTEHHYLWRLSCALHVPVGAHVAHCWGCRRDYTADGLVGCGSGSDYVIGRLDGRPAVALYRSGATIGQAVAVYRHAWAHELWAAGYGSPRSPDAVLIWTALRRQWRLGDMLAVHQVYGTDRLPRDAVAVANVAISLARAMRRVCGLDRCEEPHRLRRAARLLLRLWRSAPRRTRRGEHCRLAVLAALQARYDEHGADEIDVDLVRDALAGPLWRLRRRVGSVRAQWRAIGCDVDYLATVAPEPGARELLAGLATPVCGEIADCAARLSQLLGRHAAEYVRRSGLSLHDAGQMPGGDLSPAGRPGLRAWIVRHFGVACEHPERRHQLARIVAAWQPDWATLRWSEALVAARAVRYVGLALAPDVADACARVGLSTSDAEHYAKWLAGHAPVQCTRTPPVDVVLDGLRLRTVAFDDPIGPLLGVATGCCQHPGGAASSSAAHGWSHPGGCFWVVEDGRGDIVAQSWVWRRYDSPVVCCDSIESHGDRRRVIPIYRLAARQLLRLVAAPSPGWGGIVSVHVGGRYDGLVPVRLVTLERLARPPRGRYTDADETQSVLVSAAPGTTS